MNPQNRHLIAVDLDDTILSDLFSLNAKSVWKLMDLQDAGHVVMIATARPTCIALPYYRALGLTSLLSTVNGNYLYHPDDPSFTMIRHELDAEQTEHVIRAIREHSLSHAWMQSDDLLWAVGEPPKVPYFRIMFGQSRVTRVQELPLLPCGRIFASADTETQAMAVKAQLDAVPGVHTSVYSNRHGSYSVSVSSTEADKWTTVQEAAAYYGIDKQNIWCFGDENNDRQMVMNAAHGHVMVNGNPALIADMKALGKGITRLPCAEGGVADMLQELL
ncbi:MAG: HAD family phosphatase [Clostridia bacterium]|nr:HAD family phosphatase [Clostridia bacterium]